jgi:peptide/nickel transport system substrate-binding protein
MNKWTTLAAASLLALPISAQAAKTSLNVAMTLEPPGLDPTTGAAAAIAQITLYNIYEGLTRINEDATVSPMLAESWTISDDGKTYTFKLFKGVKFHDGTDFDAADVKFTYERGAAEDSKNKGKKYLRNITSIGTPDAHTVTLTLAKASPTFLFDLGRSTTVMVNPESADSNGTKPVGTGPFKFVKWTKGDSVEMVKDPGYRDAGSISLEKVKFRFINDQAAQIAAIIAGDLDVIPFSRASEALGAIKKVDRLVVTHGTTEGETILSTNNKHPALSKLKVRQAIAHALNRQEIIEGAMFGAGIPIGSHFAPHNPDYVDLTATYPYDPDKSKKLLADAGHGGGLELTLKLPPTGYARDGGQIVAQQLNEAGFKIKIINVEWPVWLKEVYKQKNYDLSIVSHVEPMDIGIYARKGYYFQYDNADFNALIDKANSAMVPAERSKYLKEAQVKLARDAVNGYLFQLAKTTIKDRKLKGIWKNSPMFVNDLRSVSWSD